MQDGFGNIMYIFNPFTYDQLRKMAAPGSIDRYLRCVSQLQYGQKNNEFEKVVCENIRPDYEGFKKQGSSLIAVIERCKANFQQMQWDVGAFLAYDAAGMRKLGASPLSLSDGVGDCLLRAHANRESNGNCMATYLSKTFKESSTSPVYWMYTKSEEQNTTTSISSSDDVDACIVFSGPAKKKDGSPTTLAFQKCSHDYAETGCLIPHMVRFCG